MSLFPKSSGENKPVKSVKVLPASIKPMNLMQKYTHFIELFVCSRKMFAFMFFFQWIFEFPEEHVQQQNYQNRQYHFFYKIKQSNVY